MSANAVEFLVKLGIDEEKSRHSINAFLKTISNKQLKLTYSVNVGASQDNIKKFIDKHNNKHLKVDFDVNKKVSNDKFKEYLDNKKLKANVSLDINKEKSKENINKSISSLSKLKAHLEILVDKKSNENIKNFVEKLKLNNKYLTLAVKTRDTQSAINKSIRELKIADIKVAVGISSKALTSLKNEVNTALKGVTGEFKLDTVATKNTISEQIRKMELPKFRVDVIANIVPSITKQAQLEVQQKTTPATPAKVQNANNQEQLQRNIAKNNSSYTLSGYEGTIKEVKEKIKKDFEEVNKEVRIFNGNILKAEDKFIKELEAKKAKLDITRDSQTKQITQITATTRNSDNETITTTYKPLLATYDSINAKVKNGSKEVRGFVAETDRVSNKNFYDVQKGIEAVTKKLSEAKHKGHIFGEQLNEIQSRLSKVRDNNSLNAINNDLSGFISQNKQNQELIDLRLKVLRQREQILASVTRTENLYRRTHDKQTAQDIKSSVNLKSQEDIYSSDMDIKGLKAYSRQLQLTQTQVSQFHAKATEATKNSMGIISSLKVAMEKFPIWMMASTAFYGTIRTIREFGTIIVDIDKKMTDLKKVMSTDTDFAKIFDQATTSAETFGKTISETLDAYNQFAKQGYKGDELQVLANAGLVAGNVGDIEAGKASEYLTASLLQWDKDSSQAMGIVDSWNQISNNFATTVENLAQGQAKAGATAKALGMDFDQLNAVVGTLNARTKQSGNEIGNFVKSTFSNLLSNNGKGVLEDLGVALSNEDGTLRDVMEIYKDVAEKYKQLGQADKTNIALGLAGKYHVARMQTLLDDLSKGDESMYEQMYNSSVNSVNSAMNENQLYMKSFEARINLARVEVEKLALAIGDAFLNEAMIQGLKMFGSLLQGATNLVDTFGVLPTSLVTMIGLLTVFSNRFNDIIKKAPTFKTMFNFSKDKISNFMSNALPSKNKIEVETLGKDGWETHKVKINSVAIEENRKARLKLNKTISSGSGVLVANRKVVEADTVKTNVNTKVTQLNTDAKTKSSKALSLLSAGFSIWGIAIAGAGFALEALLKQIAKNREEKEALLNQQEQETAYYKTNGQTIDSLVAKYKQLSNTKVDLNSEQYSELLEIQNELAELLPSLKMGEDAYGNAILQNYDIVIGRIELLKEQLDIQKQIADIEKEEERKKDIKEAKKSYSKQKESVDGGIKKVNSTLTTNLDFAGLAFKAGASPYVQNIEQLIQLQKKLTEKSKDVSFVSSLTETEKTAFNVLKTELYNTFKEVNSASLAMNSSLNVLRSNSQENLLDILESSTDMSEGTINNFNNIVSSAMQMADSIDEIQNIEDIFGKVQISQSMQDAFSQFTVKAKTLSADSEITLDKLTNDYQTAFDEINKSILDSTGVEETSASYKNIADALNNATASMIKNKQRAIELAETKGIPIEQAEQQIAILTEESDAIEDNSTALAEYVSNIKKFNSLEEERLGYTESQVEETKSLINTYDALKDVTNKTAKEQSMFEKAMQRLVALYPNVTKLSDFRIDSIKQELDKVSTLTTSYKNLTDDLFTEEEKRTYNSAVGTNTRIEILRNEMLALDKAYAQYAGLNNSLEYKIANGIALTENEQRAGMSLANSSKSVEYFTQRNALNTEYDNLLIDLNSDLSALSIANKRAEESTKSNSSATDKATKISEKYALSLEKINTEIDKINSQKKNYASHSANYRKALEQENKLLQKQYDIYSQQAKDWGKTSTSNSSSNYSAMSTGDTQDTVWSFFKNKGLNEKAISGIMGNIQMESSFNSDAGKRDGTSAYGLFQWLGSRKEELIKYANSVGKDMSDVQAQLEFMWKELNSTESATYSMLTKNNHYTVGKFADEFDRLFERSERTHITQRKDYASGYYTAYSGKSATSSIGTGTTSPINSSGSSDPAQEIEKLLQTQQGILDKIADNKYAIIQSYLDEYEYNRKLQDSIIEQKKTEKTNLENYSEDYHKATSSQYEAEKKKRKLYNDELYYVNKLLESGKLNEAQTYEMLERQAELTREIKESELAMKSFHSEVVQGKLDGFSKKNKDQDDTIAWEQLKLQGITQDSSRYNSTLQNINNARSKQLEYIKEEQTYVSKMLKDGQLTKDMYDTLVQRAKDLKNEAEETLQSIRQTNYEMIQTNIANNDRKIANTDYKIQKSQAIQGLYDEGSADYVKELNFELEQQRIKLEQVQKKSADIQSDMMKYDLGSPQVEELKEQFQDTTMEIYNIQKAIKDTEKEIIDSVQAINDEIKEKREDLAEEIIDALKDYYEELRDIKIKSIEDEIEAEEKRHDKVMKQYDDELEAYRKIIEAKKREIDDEDRDRTHTMNIDELVKERQELQSKLNLLSNVNTYAGKKEKEELQKKIDEVNKKIEEENYNYSKELRKQQLDDELSEKEEYYKELEELEDEKFEKNKDSYEAEKEYWNDYYDDKVNDEKEFAKIRKAIAEGSAKDLSKILEGQTADFKSYIKKLKDSLPDLENTLNGTMTAVGTNIRNGVILDLEKLLETIQKVDSEVTALEKKRDVETNSAGHSDKSDSNIFGVNGNGELTENDLKVLLAKFASENMVSNLNSEKDKATITGVRDKASALASQARTGENASKISDSAKFNDILSTLSESQMKQVGSFFTQNSGLLNISNENLNKYIANYGDVYSKAKTLSEGDKLVMLAKYMKETLKPLTTDKTVKASLEDTATKLAIKGRANASLISSDVDFDTAFKELTGSQKYELGQYMASNSSVVTDGSLKGTLESYAKRLQEAYRNSASLDTGGMTGNWSGSGVDGKGGKYAILHPNEVISNPIDTNNMLKVSSIMEGIMSVIGKAINLPSFSKPSSINSQSENNKTEININIDKMNGTQSDIDNLAKQIQNKLLREKGKR